MSESNFNYAFRIIIAISLLCIIPLRQLKVEFNIENLLPIGNPESELYRKFKEEFHADIDYGALLVILENDGGIFQKTFLKKADSLANSILKFKNVQKIYSLTNSSFIYFTNGEFNARPVIHITDPDKYPDDSIHLFNSPEYRDLLISKSGKAVAIVVFSSPDINGLQKEALLSQIKEKIAGIGFDNAHVAGKIQLESEANRDIKIGFIISLFCSILFNGLLLYLKFKSLRLIIWFVLGVILSCAWTLALMSLFHLPVDLLTCIMPLILSITCLLVFSLILKHRTDLIVPNFGIDQGALQAKSKSIIFPLVFVGILTLPVFSLMMVNISSVRNFALYTGIGMMFSIFICLGLMQMFLHHSWSKYTQLFPEFKTSGSVSTNRQFNLAVKSKIAVAILMFGFVIGTIFLISQYGVRKFIFVQSPEMINLTEDDQFMENEFYGLRPFELLLSVKDSSITFRNKEVLKQVEVIETYLRDSFGVAYLISPISLFKGANKAYHGGSDSAFILPESQDEINLYAENIMQTQYADEMQRYLLQDGTKLRISGRLRNLSRDEINKRKDQLNRFLSQGTHANTLEWQFTGPSVLFDQLPYFLLRKLLLALLLAFSIMMFIMYSLVRSWQLVLIGSFATVVLILMQVTILEAFDIHLYTFNLILLYLLFGFGIYRVICNILSWHTKLRQSSDRGEFILTIDPSSLRLEVIVKMILFTICLVVISFASKAIVQVALLVVFFLFSSLFVHYIILPLFYNSYFINGKTKLGRML